MIEITYFIDDQKPVDKKYTGDSAGLSATLDMDAHIRRGGWCLAEYQGKSVIVSNIAQLGF